MFAFYSIFCIFLTLAYLAIMAIYWLGWRKLKAYHLPKNNAPKTFISVLIPARNEAENIGTCLESILLGNFPKTHYEIIVIDDHSEDETAQIVLNYSKNHQNIRLIKLSEHLNPDEKLQSPKKKAVETAIKQAKGTLIVTTDADCVVLPDWLSLIVAAFEEYSPKMIAAPVVFHKEKNLLQWFQSLDFVGMMGITGAGIHWGFQRMGNGANLAYTKAVFEEVNGFEGVDDRASGDDMYLLQKVANRYPDGIFFLKNKEARVFTEAKSDWRGFVQQRIRWGSKNAAYPEKWVTILLALVFFFCWTLVINIFLLPFFTELRRLFIFQIIVKMGIDFLFLREMSLFFNKKNLLRWFIPSCFMHIVYIAFVGLMSQLVKNYEWKGRKLR
jgi:cellulose synthase/poly-beta-1,6-N-acetylglucosamine synthase-like glycosyltransferase